VWIVDAGLPTCAGITEFAISEIDPNGEPISPSTGYLVGLACGGEEPSVSSPPNGLSIDPSGNIWMTNLGDSSLLEIVGAATPVKTPLIGPPQNP